jgi:hypothetical protein
MREAWTRHFRGTTRFRPVQKLGEGGMGAVYEVDDLELGERVALKLLQRADVEAVRRFKHEYRALQDLEHPNLVRLGELHEANGTWFFSMELVPGVDLYEYVRGRGTSRRPLPTPANDAAAPGGYDEARLRSCFQQLATGLAALHAAGKVHCDIKPSNVRVTPEGRVVLLDFGLLFDSGPVEPAETGRVLGTAVYMAPEQVQGSGPCFASDWYAFGVVLYEALTGTMPFAGDGLQVMIDKVHRSAPRPSARAHDVPKDLDDLCVALLRMEPDARPKDADVLRALGIAGPSLTPERPVAVSMPAPHRVPFVGRKQELAALHAQHVEVLAGSAAVVSIEGASGLGKSALVSQFVAEARARRPEVMVLAGRCYERETARFKALDGVVEALATELSRLPLALRRKLVPKNASLLRLLFPVLGRVDVIGHAPHRAVRSRDSVEERRLMFVALRELLARLGEQRPLVITIDDMQWADGDSFELLRTLLDASHAPPPRMLVLVTAREGWSLEPGEAAPGERFPAHVQVLPLGTLPDEDTEALAREHLSGLGNVGVEPHTLVREAAGHPLFVAELAFAAHHARGGRPAPLSLDEAIWSRASLLPEEALTALVILSVAAVPLKPALLAQALGRSPTELDRLLVQLRVGALAKTVGSRESRRIEPYHDRVREAVLAQLDGEQRRDVHARLAPLLEQQEGVDPELVAQHYLDAGNHDKASALFARAAQHAEDGLAFERAALLYRAQLSLGRLSGHERSLMYRRLGASLVRAARSKAAAEAYAAALDGAQPDERVQLENLAATCLLRSGHVAEGLAALEQVLRSVDLAMPKSHSRALVAFAWERLRLYLRGYDLRYREPKDVPQVELERADALFGVAQGLSLVDGVRTAPIAAQALRAALRTGERTRIIKALAGDTSALSLGGKRTQTIALRALTALRGAAAEQGNPLLSGYVLGAESTYCNSHAFFQDSLDKADQAIAIFETPGLEAQWELVYARTFRIFAQFYLGRWREMFDEGEVALRDAQLRRDRYFESLLRIGPCSLGVVDSDPTRARVLNEEGYAPWRDRAPGFLFWCWFVKVVVLDLVDGRWDLSLAHYDRYAAAIAQSGSMYVPALRSHLCGYRAVALLEKFRAQGDRRALREAEHWLRRMGPENHMMHGWARMLRAQLQEAAGSPEALATANLAADSFRACGMERFLYMTEAYRARLIGGDEARDIMTRVQQYMARERLNGWDGLVAAFVPSLRQRS